MTQTDTPPANTLKNHGFESPRFLLCCRNTTYPDLIIKIMDRSTTAASLALREERDEKAIPAYLQKAYWWAYLHPRAIRLFERQWLVNAILWGNYKRLCDGVLESLGKSIQGRTLQVACVYGDFTQRLAQQHASTARLDVIDVAPAQLTNTRNKLQGHPQVDLHLQDSSNLKFEDGEFDNTVVFFLLHEQPERVRLATIAEAIRVTRKGGQITFVDYHRPSAWNPMRYLMQGVFRLLEPFAENFWRKEINQWAGLDGHQARVRKKLFFGGLYQLTTVRLQPN